jgi:hypothetical protein
MAGDYTALFTATLVGGAVYTDTASVTVDPDTVTGGSLTLSVVDVNGDPVTTLNATTGATATVVATVLDDTSTPVANQAVTITLQSPVFGMRLDGTTEVSGTTDASGSYTATLAVGAVPGVVTIEASSSAAAEDATATVEALTADGQSSPTQAVTLSTTGPIPPVEFTGVTLDGQARNIVITLPQQTAAALDGVSLYLNLEDIAVTEAPSGTFVIIDFELNVFLGSGDNEGDPLSTADAEALGFEFSNANGTATVQVSYTQDDLTVSGVSVAQTTTEIDEASLALYDAETPDSTVLNDDPLPNSTVENNTVTGDVRQFGVHGVAGTQTGTTLYLPLVAK